VVRLRLGERVVEDDVHLVHDALVRVDLGDDDAVAVSVEHLGNAHQHRVVVVDEGDGDRPVSWYCHPTEITSLGVYWNTP
jgi:hypothetical protein